MIKTGIVILDKPAGITSQTAVSKVKRIFGGVKAGHFGTLDPMATGVLPVVLGAATPFAEYLTSQDKEYLAGVKLGVETDTEDITGKVLKELDVNVSEQDILNVLPRFTGEIVQVPPMYWR